MHGYDEAKAPQLGSKDSFLETTRSSASMVRGMPKSCAGEIMSGRNRKEYTPGPWQLETTYFEDRISLSSDPSVCIARTGNWLHHEKAEQHANARLIAAAPDLLEALQLLH